MKKAMLFLLVVISLFACVSTVFAKDASEMIGTITSYVEEIQSYPEALRDACGTDMFKQKLSELANLITGANDAMMEAGLPNTLNLWAVYSAVTSHISDCSFFESALSKADWSREELDRIGYKFGLYDSRQMCAAGTWIGMTLGEVAKVRQGLLPPCETGGEHGENICYRVVVACYPKEHGLWDWYYNGEGYK